MSLTRPPIHIVGAGLAGSECAYQLASFGFEVVLYEMRNKVLTPAHQSSDFGELVCSNSLGSMTDYSAPGQLKWEAGNLNSLLLKSAFEHRVPAGMSLSVDRKLFAQAITEKLAQHPRIQIRREVVTSLKEVPRPAVIATGPLTHDSLAQELVQHFGNDFCYFFDAIAPIIDADSINYDIVYRADRWGKGTNDYLNCPLNKEAYFQLVDQIAKAEKVTPRDFEKIPFFEGCMPVEAFVARGPLTLRYGPCSAKGLNPEHTDRWPFAVVQLRQENREATAYNMVGFQTRMTYAEQSRVFRMIPGLEQAEFLKLGSIHRNMYVYSPQVLAANLASRNDPELFFAGQITGVEGYFESIAIGLLVAHFVRDHCDQKPFCPPPRATALGSLHAAITEPRDHFQPTNINFGLLPAIETELRVSRDEKRSIQLKRAKEALLSWIG